MLLHPSRASECVSLPLRSFQLQRSDTITQNEVIFEDLGLMVLAAPWKYVFVRSSIGWPVKNGTIYPTQSHIYTGV
jgi:hypothetical protein